MWSHHLSEKKMAEFRAMIEAQRHTEIGGQVFIVTKNGDSVKLGDVFVSVVGKADFDSALQEAADRYKTDLEDEDQKIAFFSSEQQKMLNILAAETSDAGRDSADVSAVGVLKLDNESLAYFADLKNQTLESIFDEVDGRVKILKSSITDADGKFKIEVDKSTENFYLFATVRRKIHGQSEPLMWVIEGFLASNPLLLSNANLYRADDLKRPPLPAMPESTALPASETSLRWWFNQSVSLCVIIGLAVAAFVWLKKQKIAETNSQPDASSPSNETYWKDWKKSHRVTVALLLCLTLLARSVININTQSLDYQQHPIAVVLGSLIIPIVAGLGVYWWLGRGNKNPAKEHAPRAASGSHPSAPLSPSPVANYQSVLAGPVSPPVMPWYQNQLGKWKWQHGIGLCCTMILGTPLMVRSAMNPRPQGGFSDAEGLLWLLFTVSACFAFGAVHRLHAVRRFESRGGNGLVFWTIRRSFFSAIIWGFWLACFGFLGSGGYIMGFAQAVGATIVFLGLPYVCTAWIPGQFARHCAQAS